MRASVSNIKLETEEEKGIISKRGDNFYRIKFDVISLLISEKIIFT